MKIENWTDDRQIHIHTHICIYRIIKITMRNKVSRQPRSSPVPLSVWSPIIPGKRTSGPFEDRITPSPRNGNKPIHVRNFADDLSTYVFLTTCIYAVQNFENSRPLDRGNNNRGKRTQAESAVVQSTLKHQTPTIPEGRGRWGRKRAREREKKEKKHRPPPLAGHMHLHVFPSLPRMRAHSADFVFTMMRRKSSIHRLIDSCNLISHPRFPCSRYIKRRYIRDGMRFDVLVSRHWIKWRFVDYSARQQF